jgi:transcriptional repressor NrdR
MECPYCKGSKTKVTRTSTLNGQVIRERKCTARDCGVRFSTVETITISNAEVIKRDGRYESFDPNKLRRSIELACDKLNIKDSSQADVFRNVVHRLGIQNKQGEKLRSRQIGEVVAEYLLKVDVVAWSRYSSYFHDENHFNMVRLLAENLQGNQR